VSDESQDFRKSKAQNGARACAHGGKDFAAEWRIFSVTGNGYYRHLHESNSRLNACPIKGYVKANILFEKNFAIA
jgi:hypothetical protein